VKQTYLTLHLLRCRHRASCHLTASATRATAATAAAAAAVHTRALHGNAAEAGTAAATVATITARVASEDYKHTSCAYTLSPAMDLGSCSILRLPPLQSPLATRCTCLLMLLHRSNYCSYCICYYCSYSLQCCSERCDSCRRVQCYSVSLSHTL
jgi:hypothetical protein